MLTYYKGSYNISKKPKDARKFGTFPVKFFKPYVDLVLQIASANFNNKGKKTDEYPMITNTFSHNVETKTHQLKVVSIEQLD